MDDGDIVTFVEERHNPVDFERNLRTIAFRRTLTLVGLAAGAPIVEIDEVNSRRGFDLVEEILGQTGTPEAGDEMGSRR